MELSTLREHPITDTFEDRGDTLTVTFNANAFTPAFLRSAAAQIRKLAAAGKKSGKSNKGKKTSESDATAKGMEVTADVIEIQHEVFATLLTDPERPILSSWDVTDNGEPVPPSREVLMSLHPRTVIGLWDFCMERAGPKKREIVETSASPTISETTETSSPVSEISADGPIG